MRGRQPADGGRGAAQVHVHRPIELRRATDLLAASGGLKNVQHLRHCRGRLPTRYLAQDGVEHFLPNVVARDVLVKLRAGEVTNAFLGFGISLAEAISQILPHKTGR
ncbi:hypothetical protein C7I87_28245 [Mesorhizobium sp. SARCC-RB16n]|nr:hypothetical protein C7I87_28245 [Mesorhizobium sp. SARCC-RB16n]